VTIVPKGECGLLKAYVPDLAANVIAPLREAGFPDETLSGLGGRTILNPLVEFLSAP
jgi:hypothetical protein